MADREQNNRSILAAAFANARENPGNYVDAILATDMGTYFKLNIAADDSFSSRAESGSVKNLDEVDLPKFDYHISSPEMFSYQRQINDNAFHMSSALDAYASAGDAVRHEVVLSGMKDSFSHYTVTEQGYINMIAHDMNNFQVVKDKDLRMKRNVANEMRTGNCSYVKDGQVYLYETVSDAHRDVYGNKPTTDIANNKSMMTVSVEKDGIDASYAFGPKVNLAAGNGQTVAYFYLGHGKGETTVYRAKDYCQLHNMHMLYGTELDGGTNGDMLVCFTEPDALTREINGSPYTYPSEWAKRKMAMGQDMMLNEEFVGVPYPEGMEPKHPEDNISTKQKCRDAMSGALSNLSGDVMFDAYVATGKKATFVVNADDIEGMDIKMVTYDGNPVKHPIVIADDISKQDAILKAFDDLTTTSFRMDKALKAGYDYSYGEEHYGVDAPATEEKKELSYKLGKDSHGRMKFRGTAMIDGKPTEVTVSKTYGEHEFNDAEIKALLSGNEVTIHGFKTKSGAVQDVTGKLGTQQYQGRSFIGFTRTDLQPRKAPAGMDMISAPEHDGVQMQ